MKKIFLLLFLLSILGFTGCDNDENTIPNQLNEMNNLSEILQNKFDKNSFSNTLPYEYSVDWSNPIKKYSDELKMVYYEFPIQYTTSFNPDNILNLSKQKNGYHIYFKIFVTYNGNKEFNFYISKYYKI